jgi:methylenetetrahydrofolate reductase (NADPH)
MARITDLLAAGQTFSFEFFPPKDEAEQRLLTRTIADLQPLQPSYVSVTYRGGRISRERTTRVDGTHADAAPDVRGASALRAR